MTNRRPTPPTGLAARGKRFWRATCDDFDLTDAELVLLTEVCRCLDNLDALDAVVRRDGATTLGSQGQTVVHPALTEARGQRLALHRLIAALALPDDEGQPVPTARSLRAQTAANARWRGKDTEAAARRQAGA